MYLIKNDDQKSKTLKRIREFERRLLEIRRKEGPQAAELFSKAYGKHIEELGLQVKKYEQLRQRGLKPATFSDPAQVGRYLIEARIAARMTQEQLSRKLRVSQPMVHKYEASGYAGCGLDVLTKVAQAIGLSISLALGARVKLS